MRRYSWLITIVLIAAIFWWKHSSVPMVPYPDNVTPTVSGIQVPVSMQIPQTGAEAWTLAQTANHQFIVNVYNRQTVVSRFNADSETSHDINGTTYTTTGHIKLGLEDYQATEIHINADGKTGYIVFTPLQTAPFNNAVQNGATNASS